MLEIKLNNIILNKTEFKKVLVKLVLFFIFFLNSMFSQTPTNWDSRGVGGGGAMFAPSFNPNNDKEIYLSCDMSEVFHSTTLGSSWETVDFRKLQANKTNFIQFINNSKILFAISGREYSMKNAKPVTSTDGGVSWIPLPNDPTGGSTYSLLVNPNDRNRMILSGYNDVYYSNNGGTSFKNILTYGGTTGCHIAGAFFDSDTIYISTKTGLLISKNAGSANPIFTLMDFSGIPKNESVYAFTGAKKNGTVRFFCITIDSNQAKPSLLPYDDYPVTAYRNFYTIDLGQNNWTSLGNKINTGEKVFFVGMSRNDINTIYLCGVLAANIGQTSNMKLIYKSTDAGNTWTNVFRCLPNVNIFTGWGGYQGDNGWGWWGVATGFNVSPVNPNIAIMADKGFLHLTTDGGNTWKQIYTDQNIQHQINAPTPTRQYYKGIGLEPTVCWWVSWCDSLNMFVSFTDILANRSTDGGKTFSFDYSNLCCGGTGGTFVTYQTILHPTTKTLYSANSLNSGEMYQAIRLEDSKIDPITGKISYSNDKGLTWNVLHDFGHVVIWMAIDQKNPNRMYASVVNHSSLSGAMGGIWVTQDLDKGSSSTWTKLTDPPRTENHPFNIHILNDGTLLCTYSGRIESTTGKFTSSAGVFISTDRGSTWIDRSANELQYYTMNLTIDPNDLTQNTWYVGAFLHWNSGGTNYRGLYKTTDRGITWKRIFNQDNVFSCTFHPTRTNEMYMSTTNNGLYYCTQMNTATPNFKQIDEYPFRYPTRVFFNPYNSNEVWITSFGNGVRIGYEPKSTITISGTIKFGNNPLSGVIVSCPGANSTTPITTDTSGTYLFTVNAGGNYTVIPSKVNYTFTPTNQVFSNVTNNQTQNFIANLVLPEKAVLKTPLNNATVKIPSNNPTITFIWNTSNAASDYQIQVADNLSFSLPIKDKNGINGTFYDITIPKNNTTYYWRVRGNNSTGYGDWSDVWNFNSNITSVEKLGDAIPIVYGLKQNYPNPFNPETVINYQLPVDCFVILKVYNILGKEITTLVNENQNMGKHQVKWLPNSTKGGLSSGIYYYRLLVSDSNPLQTNNFSEMKKMIYIR